jgi:hypothetical protein
LDLLLTIMTRESSLRFCKISSVFVGAALIASSAGATVFLNENFDGYANQAAFDAVWTPVTTAATLSLAQSASPSQSVLAGTAAQRSLRTVAEIGTLTGSSDIVDFRFNFYDSNGTAPAYREYAELDDSAAPTGSGQLFAMGLNNNLTSSSYMARILGGDGGAGVSAFFKLDGAGAPTRSTGWHTLEARIGDNQVDYYVDNILSKTVNISTVTDRSLDTVKLGSGITSGSAAYFDDVYVERLTPVPEPSVIALAALTFAGLLARRRK